MAEAKTDRTPIGPSDQELIQTYSEIESTARTAITAGKVIGNPILTGNLPEVRFGFTPMSIIHGPAQSFLANASRRISEVAPSAQMVPPELIHIAIRDMVNNVPQAVQYYNSEPNEKLSPGRRKDLVTMETVNQYYRALFDHFPKTDHHPSFRLVRVLPTLDPPINKDSGRSVSIVAGFITEGDDGLFKARQDFTEALEKAGLPLSSSLRALRVIFATVGRLREVPIKAEKVPLLETLDDINSSIHKNYGGEIRDIDLIVSTDITPASFMDPSGYIFVSPPIAFMERDQKRARLRLLKPWQRIEELRTS